MAKDFQRIVSEYGASFVAIDAADMAAWRGDFRQWHSIEAHSTEYGGFTLQRHGKQKSMVLHHDLFTAMLVTSRGAHVIRGGSPIPSRAKVELLLSSVPRKAWKPFRRPWELTSGRLLIFDCGATGDAGMSELRAGSEGGVIDVTLKPREYALSFAMHADHDFLRLSA